MDTKTQVHERSKAIKQLVYMDQTLNAYESAATYEERKKLFRELVRQCNIDTTAADSIGKTLDRDLFAQAFARFFMRQDHMTTTR